MDLLWIYIFEDGTEITLVNQGFSVGELWKMEELHGKYAKRTKSVKILANET